MGRVKTAVLVSGRGSNLQALIDAAATPDYPAELVLVIANRPGALGLARATRAGIPTATIDHETFAERAAFDAVLTAELERADAAIVCLAGFMRLLTEGFIAHWKDRLINIHPSLLPVFPGLDTHARALEAGVKLHGCTVHFVRPEMDSGPIIGQAAVPVRDRDDPDRLAARVLEAEHRLYPHCLRLLAEGRLTIAGDRVLIRGGPDPGAAPLIHPAP